MHWSISRTVGAALLLAAGGLGAQGIYRCGNSYGQQPCAGGSTVIIDPTPSAADAEQARRGAAADARRADEMEQARLRQERNAPGAVILADPRTTGNDDAQDGKKGKEAKKKASEAGKQPAPFTAVGPRPPAKPTR